MRDEEKTQTIIRRIRFGGLVFHSLFSIFGVFFIYSELQSASKNIGVLLFGAAAVSYGLVSVYRITSGSNEQLSKQVEETFCKLRAQPTPPLFDGQFQNARGYSFWRGKHKSIRLIDQDLNLITAIPIGLSEDEPIVEWAKGNLVEVRGDFVR